MILADHREMDDHREMEAYRQDLTDPASDAVFMRIIEPGGPALQPITVPGPDRPFMPIIEVEPVRLDLMETR